MVSHIELQLHDGSETLDVKRKTGYKKQKATIGIFQSLPSTFASFCGMVRSCFLDQVTVRLFLSNVLCVRRGDPPFSCLLINPLYPPHLYFPLQGENSLELHCLCLVLLLSLRWSGCGYVLHDVGPVGYAGWMMFPRSCRQYE